MNEQQPIFTPEQFRAQAVELSQAVAELQRRDSRTIDPQDPFENETEFHAYQSDYAEIVPQIRIPGCRIPLRANAREKSKIRRFYNMVGLFLLLHLVCANGIAVGIELLFLKLVRAVDSMAVAELPSNYKTMVFDYFNNSSSLIAMNLLAFGLANILVIWLGCRLTKIKVPNLFRTKNFTVLTALSYITIILFIQMAMGYAALGLTDLFKGVGIVFYEPNLGAETDPKTIILTIIYTVIVAPITEELLMRGLVLKNLSRVSQRFGICMSAFIFGLWHENVAQFLLAFVGGLFFGYIAVKHDSLIPSMICHMAVNAFAETGVILQDNGLDTAVQILDIIYVLLTFVGFILLIRMLIVERFPRTTPHQAERGLRQAIASPLLMLALGCHAALAVVMIVVESK